MMYLREICMTVYIMIKVSMIKKETSALYSPNHIGLSLWCMDIPLNNSSSKIFMKRKRKDID